MLIPNPLELTGVAGWLTLNEQNTLRHYAEQVPDFGHILEIGAQFGGSASVFAKFSKANVNITSVDLFPDGVLGLYVSHLRKAGLDRTYPIKADSKEYAAKWDVKKPINLLFIDGDHTYEGALSDARLWHGYVPHNGVIIFHDSTPPTNKNPHYLHHEVNRAIEQWLIENKGRYFELQPSDSMRVFMKVR